MLAESAPQTATAGPVTLILGSDFAGVNALAARHYSATGGKTTTAPATGATQGSQAAVQSRNAAASICSGLPAASLNPGHL